MMFMAANCAVLPGWAMLCVAPGSPTVHKYCTFAICFVAVLYITSLVLGGDVEGASFITLEGVMNIFQRGGPFVLNGCWLHYLALDLATGLGIAKDSARNGFSRLWVAPIIILVCMFGPSGFLAYTLVKIFLEKKNSD